MSSCHPSRGGRLRSQLDSNTLIIHSCRHDRHSGADPSRGARNPGSQGALRHLNQERLVEFLLANGPSTQAELARGTGLSTATVSNIVRDMAAKGVVATSPGDLQRAARAARPADRHRRHRRRRRLRPAARPHRADDPRLRRPRRGAGGPRTRLRRARGGGGGVHPARPDAGGRGPRPGVRARRRSRHPGPHRPADRHRAAGRHPSGMGRDHPARAGGRVRVPGRRGQRREPRCARRGDLGRQPRGAQPHLRQDRHRDRRRA